MPEKGRMSDKDKNRIAEKMSDFILLMGYNADFQVILAKELNRQMWMSSENLGRKQCRELLYLLYMADSATLLSFTVCLGRLIWESHLRAKRRRRNFRRKLVEKMKQRERHRKRRQKSGKLEPMAIAGWGAKSGSMTQMRGRLGCCYGKIGFRMRPNVWSMVAKYRVKKDLDVDVDVGSRIYRLALAMCFLSFRNICVTSEWEFWAVCFIKQVFGFWRSISIGGGLDETFTCIANAFGFDVVSCELLERLQSCLRCSSTTRYQGLF